MAVQIAVYTSFAINYLAKARVLADSIKAHSNGIDVYALVADRFPDGIDPGLEPFKDVWLVEEYRGHRDLRWIFRHSIMELATAVKGWALTRLLDMGYDYVIYLDPDCWVLDDIRKIVALLPKDKSAGVVPHTLSPATTREEIRLIEMSSLRHGIYNLGFLIVKNDTKGKTLAEWWANRLHDFCLDEFENGLFTDQRWFDLAVGYFDFIHVIRHKGIDVASWNIGSRTITKKGSKYYLDGDLLLFYHFSGVGPKGVHRWVRDIFAPSDPLASELEFEYEAAINARGQASLSMIRPFFDLYSDGEIISASHRRIFRNSVNFQALYDDPFDVTSVPNFRSETNREELSMNVMVRSALRDDVEAGASLLFDEGAFDQMADDTWRSRSILEKWEANKGSGWTDTYTANRLFDEAYYSKFVSPDEQAGFATPLHHFIASGLDKALSPSWAYDEAYYLKRYPDILDAVRASTLVCGFQHYSLYGYKEGRIGCAYFSECAYLKENPDVMDAFMKGLILSGTNHYINFGWREKRSTGGI